METICGKLEMNFLKVSMQHMKKKKKKRIRAFFSVIDGNLTANAH